MAGVDFHTNPHTLAERTLFRQAWESRSFLVFADSPVLQQVFADLQLKPDSQELASKSLLRFLDSVYPEDGSVFVTAKARDLKRLAFRWLSVGGAGRRFWRGDEKHIEHGELTEDFGVLEWSDSGDCDEIIYNVKELLVAMKGKVKRFYELSEQYSAEEMEAMEGKRPLPESEDEDEDDDEDDDDEEEDKDDEEEDDDKGDGKGKKKGVEAEKPAQLIGQKRKREEEDDSDGDGDGDDESRVYKTHLTIQVK